MTTTTPIRDSRLPHVVGRTLRIARCGLLLAMLVFGSLPGEGRSQGGPNEPAVKTLPQATIDRLIADLGDAKYSKRQEAQLALSNCPGAVDSLRRALLTSDAEVRQR